MQLFYKVTTCFEIRRINHALTLVILLCLCTNLRAQYVLKNKLCINLDYGIQKKIGGPYISKDGISLPSLFYQSGGTSNFSISGNYVFNSIIGVSAGTDLAVFNNWNNTDNSNLYSNSKIRVNTFKPGLFLSKSHSETGLWNRMKVDLTLGPLIGWYKMIYGESFRWNGNSNIPVSNIMEASDTFYGLFTRVSLRYMLFQLADFHLTYGLDNYWLGSGFISDKTTLIQYFGFGVGFRFVVTKSSLYE